MSIGFYCIVKDEAESLPRLLASIEGAFDEYVLCDTGSTDDTVDVFWDWVSEYGSRQRDCASFKVRNFEWCDNYGAARQHALEHVQSDWAVWCDADDTCDDAHAVHDLIGAVEQQDPGANGIMMPYSWTPAFTGHILRAARRGCSRWTGRLHETQVLDGRFVTDDSVGWRTHRGSGTRDLTVDVKMLQADIDDDPTNSRAQFYLAQTYKDMRAYPEAIREYDKRVRMGGWAEEVYYSLYMGAVMAAESGGPSWMERFMAAYEFRPTRAEAPYELARRLRVAGYYRTALGVALGGMATKQPGDILFVHRNAGDWGLQFEASICYWWTGDYRECILLSEGLLERDDIGEAHRLAIRSNVALAEERLGV